ncbi:YgcG family protein [Carboxydocella sp. ULO1]|uniref:TPM domain-containing protein n=1 Tax=Carboxydocella sp. ULO1 TaxID=1926599 RepID=UPI0009AC06E6|nr:TPM domain-containing protein [Carboxydocella sp. ULO1]GAW28086.1 hypothetical protein ULO1_06560 [Carboxydocella sp. ULO1]
MRISWRRVLPVWILLFSFLIAIFNTAWSADIYVQDRAEILSPEVARRINQLGAALEQATPGAQVVVMTLPSLEGKPISQIAVEEFRRLGIGSKEHNNGVLFVIAPNEREVRIEVGYGLEGAIPDGKAGRILDESVLPYFRQGDYNRGIENGYRRLVEEVAREYQVKNLVQPVEPEQKESRKNITIAYIIAGLLLLDVLFNRARITRLLMDLFFYAAIFGGGRRGGGGFGGGSSGGGGAEKRW